MKPFIITIFFVVALFAHPHFFMDASIEIEKNKITHTWIFDRINSRLLIFDFDTNRDKSFDKEEQKRFLQTHFDKLQDNNYNLFMEIDGKELQALPNQTTVSIHNKQVVINFELLLTIHNDGVLCTIDPSLYFAYKLNNITTKFQTQIQKSEHDYCIGVTP